MKKMETLAVNGQTYEVVDKKAREIAGNAASKTYVNNTFANAIKDTLIGAAVSTDMVSPIQHDIVCKIESKNLIPFPYATSSVTKDGITWTVNEDGTIIANGTVSAESGKTNFMIVVSGAIDIPDGSFLSGCPKVSGVMMQIGFSNGYPTDYGSGVFIEKGGPIYYLQIIVKKGTSLNNAIFKPQIEKGNKATPYTPYVPDLTKVHVKTYALTPDSADTFTPSADGTVSGMVSFSPNMTILTDTEGVTIEATYNMDTNKVISKLSERIAALEKLKIGG